MISVKSLATTAVLSVGLIAINASAASATSNYYFPHNGHIYAIYGNMLVCQMEHKGSGITCVPLGSYCNHDFYGAKSNVSAANGRWARGDDVAIKSRASDQLVCRISS